MAYTTVKVKCEARDCPNDAARRRHLNGQPYLLCALHHKIPLSQLQLDPPDPVKLYHSIHPRAKRDGL